MEQTVQETLTAQIPLQSNGGITGHEEVTGHNKGTRQEGSDSTQIPSAHEAGQRARVATATFGEIVALLSFSPVFKHLSLGDLEWLVIPALATNQVTVVRGKLKDQNGLTVPIGLAFGHMSRKTWTKSWKHNNRRTCHFGWRRMNGRAERSPGCWLCLRLRKLLRRW